MKVVQVGHACQEAGFLYGLDRKIQNNLVVLEVKNQDILLQTQEILDKKGIECTMFYEPDNDLGYTAICTQPLRESKIENFKNLKLLSI
jgi:hypothetical protein